MKGEVSEDRQSCALMNHCHYSHPHRLSAMYKLNTHCNTATLRHAFPIHSTPLLSLQLPHSLTNIMQDAQVSPLCLGSRGGCRCLSSSRPRLSASSLHRSFPSCIVFSSLQFSLSSCLLLRFLTISHLSPCPQCRVPEIIEGTEDYTAVRNTMIVAQTTSVLNTLTGSQCSGRFSPQYPPH